MGGYPEIFRIIRKISSLSRIYLKGPETSQCNFKGYAQKLSGRAKTFRVAMPPCHPGFWASGNNMQYNAIPYSTMQYHAIPYSTMQYHAITCNTMQYNAIPYNTMQYHAIQCNTMQYHAI